MYREDIIMWWQMRQVLLHTTSSLDAQVTVFECDLREKVKHYGE